MKISMLVAYVLVAVVLLAGATVLFTERTYANAHCCHCICNCNSPDPGINCRIPILDPSDCVHEATSYGNIQINCGSGPGGFCQQ